MLLKIFDPLLSCHQEVLLGNLRQRERSAANASLRWSMILSTHEVFSFLLAEKLIGLSLMQKILSWRHTGFNVHSKVRSRDRKETERVGKYMIRSLLSLQRLSFDETEDQVCYQYDKSQPKEDRMDYPEFIARVTSHIPDKGQVMVRYF